MSNQDTVRTLVARFRMQQSKDDMQRPSIAVWSDAEERPAAQWYQVPPTRVAENSMGTTFVAPDGARWFRWGVGDHLEKHGETLAGTAVYDNDGPNKAWSRWTPSGDFRLYVTNPGAWGALPPGSLVEVTFRVIPED